MSLAKMAMLAALGALLGCGRDCIRVPDHCRTVYATFACSADHNTAFRSCSELLYDVQATCSCRGGLTITVRCGVPRDFASCEEFCRRQRDFESCPGEDSIR